MVDDRIQPLGPTAVTSQDTVVEFFVEDAATAKDSVAPKPTRHDGQFYLSTAKRQVCRPAQISALNASALRSSD
ncbi:hypothetical protein MEA186_06478 [Mesorhizobium amorphae CCNWGS0123]|uniref:Uncharacterized protein n=1 Tax=Mesorhizobium amorphae CCNWGS0123 TaxID=1082933 RepID=G6Y5T6_9HYPH|nr:hypothetical protein A6B35_29720 [Mesorhizobium amorphae CCNWGS0123]EHH12912.1 hypothetical protein MEA186_06478 [Mesorhizobium amorphae CCNWGS0123]